MAIIECGLATLQVCKAHGSWSTMVYSCEHMEGSLKTGTWFAYLDFYSMHLDGQDLVSEYLSNSKRHVSYEQSQCTLTPCLLKVTSSSL